MNLSNHIKLLLLVLTASFFAVSNIEAQEVGKDDRVRIFSELERSTILIGEQTNLKISIAYPQGASVALALPEDTLVNGVEIIQTNLIDSTSINDQIQKLVYNVTITSFDSATYHLANIRALVAGVQYEASDDLSLMVNTIPVDVENPDQYADIKDQWKPKFVWQDYLMYLYVLLGLIALAVAIYYLIRYLKKRKVTAEITAEEEIILDPYEEAIQGIMMLKSKELWAHNQIKQYYTELSEILRKYLWRVYGISTAEKTSDEILEQFKSVIGGDRMYQELRNILLTADLAKFAKYQPSGDENLRFLFTTQEFIEEHKPAPEFTNSKEGGEVK